MFLRQVALSVAAVISLTFAASVKAAPLLQMQLTSGAASSGVISDTAGTGMVMFNGALGVFSINVSTGTGLGSLNVNAGRAIDLNSVNVANSAAGSITIMLTQTGLSGTPGSTAFQSGIGGTVGSFNSAANSTLTFSTYVDTTNSAFGLGQLLYSNTFTGRGLPFSSGATSSALTSTLFSETIVVTIASAAGSTSSFDAYTTPVPVPATLALLGLGLLGVAAGLGKRRSV